MCCLAGGMHKNERLAAFGVQLWGLAWEMSWHLQIGRHRVMESLRRVLREFSLLFLGGKLCCMVKGWEHWGTVGWCTRQPSEPGTSAEHNIDMRRDAFAGMRFDYLPPSLYLSLVFVSYWGWQIAACKLVGFSSVPQKEKKNIHVCLSLGVPFYSKICSYVFATITV